MAKDQVQNGLSKEERRAKSGGANFEIGLPNAETGKVVTRFPPEPSGYLHIGHAKAAILNQYFAQAYQGKLIIRFDDTNPTKEKLEYQTTIQEDLDLLQIKGDQITYTSDYFDQLYCYALEMIKTGKAYVDDTEQAQMRAERMEGIASARRERSVEENIEWFDKMKQGTPEGLRCCLRAKLSVDSPNKALRDPVIYRCNLDPHHRTNIEWKIYPTYDFACPLIDCLEGVTHALRTIEYRDRNAQYQWMLKALGLRKVHVWEFSRLNFTRTLLSKRKLQWFVDQKVVEGWDDPRFPTIRGVVRRGMTIQALRQFMIAQGPSKNLINMDWTIFWSFNKKVIDPIAPRYTAVDREGMVCINLVNGPSEVQVVERPKHKRENLGMKRSVLFNKILIDKADADTFQDGEEITLMAWGNAFVSTSHEGNEGAGMTGTLHLDGDFKKTDKKVTWLADTDDLVPIVRHHFDYLIIKDKLEDQDMIADFLNPQSETRIQGLAEGAIRELSEGDIIQFERKGYFRLDRQFDPVSGEPAHLFHVPDGSKKDKYGVRESARTNTA